MDEKIIKIYYETFLEEEYDFNGIILTPHLNREEDRIDWEVDNPQKVSVSKSRILDYVHDLFYDFCMYVGSGPKGQRAIYDSLQRAATNIASVFTFPRGNVFLNQKDLGFIQGICPTGWHIPSATEFTNLNRYLSHGFQDTTNLNLNFLPIAID